MPSRSIVLNVLGPLLTVLVILAIWGGVQACCDVPRYLLPTPGEVLAAVEADPGRLFRNALATLKIIAIGFVASVLVAVPVGYAIVRFRFVEAALYPLLLLIQLVPKSIVAPLLVVWFGIGLGAKSTLVFLMTFFPILIEAIAGFRYIEPRYFLLTRSMGASRVQTFFRMELPAALPHVFAGIKTSMVYAITGAIIAEYIGSNEGIGYLILLASSSIDMPLTFAAVIAAGLLGVILSTAMVLLERAAMPWKQ